MEKKIKREWHYAQRLRREAFELTLDKQAEELKGKAQVHAFKEVMKNE